MTPKLFVRFSPNLNWSFVSKPLGSVQGQNEIFTKFKMAAALQLKFTNIAIKAKWLVINGPNLARTTHAIIKQQILM
jgi:hypothetical protein